MLTKIKNRVIAETINHHPNYEYDHHCIYGYSIMASREIIPISDEFNGIQLMGLIEVDYTVLSLEDNPEVEILSTDLAIYDTFNNEVGIELDLFELNKRIND